MRARLRALPCATRSPLPRATTRGSIGHATNTDSAGRLDPPPGAFGAPVPVSGGGTRCLLRRIPECLMTALADILHASTDVQQQSGILGVARLQRFQAESLQRLRKCIKALSIVLDERGYLSRLQLDARSLRFGPGGSRFATRHHQQVAPLDYADRGMTHVQPLLLRPRKELVNALLVYNRSHCSPKPVCRRIDDGFHEILDGGVDLAISDGEPGWCRESQDHRARGNRDLPSHLAISFNGWSASW